MEKCFTTEPHPQPCRRHPFLIGRALGAAEQVTLTPSWLGLWSLPLPPAAQLTAPLQPGWPLLEMVCLLLIHSSLTRHGIPQCGASPLMASGKPPTGSREQEVLDNLVSHMELPPCKPLLVPPFSFLFVFLLQPPSPGAQRPGSGW